METGSVSVGTSQQDMLWSYGKRSVDKCQLLGLGELPTPAEAY